jgi:hypothetical protein
MHSPLHLNCVLTTLQYFHHFLLFRLSIFNFRSSDYPKLITNLKMTCLSKCRYFSFFFNSSPSGHNIYICLSPSTFYLSLWLPMSHLPLILAHSLQLISVGYWPLTFLWYIMDGSHRPFFAVDLSGLLAHGDCASGTAFSLWETSASVFAFPGPGGTASKCSHFITGLCIPSFNLTFNTFPICFVFHNL